MKTVLLIDDEIPIVEILSEVLQDEGYRVITAFHGKEGLERLASSVPDVVLSDIMMPEMDGPALCQEMQSDMRLKNIPIVFMSAASSIRISEDCTYAAFLAKPFSLDVLIDTIDRVVNQT